MAGGRAHFGPGELLVLAAVAGDLTAFDQLVEEYRPAVYRTVRRIVGDPMLAEDVTQEVFLNAFRALPRLSDPRAFGAWLRMIAVRCARRRSSADDAEMHLHHPLDEAVLVLCPSVSETTEQAVLAGYDRDRVRNAVESLPDPYNETVALRFLEDMPLARVAAYQGVSLEGAKWRLRRALALLREALQET